MLSTELVMMLVLPILLEVTPLALLRPREDASPGPRFGLVWFGLVWFGLIWLGFAWLGVGGGFVWCSR